MRVIRLSRAGAKQRPQLRGGLAAWRFPRDGRFIEKLGTYNPQLAKDSKERVKLELERIQYWLSKGAQPSDRVLRFLDAAGIRKREPRNNPQRAKPRVKKGEAEAAAAAAAASAAVAKPAAPAAVPAPAEPAAPAGEAAAS